MPQSYSGPFFQETEVIAGERLREYADGETEKMGKEAQRFPFGIEPGLEKWDD